MPKLAHALAAASGNAGELNFELYGFDAKSGLQSVVVPTGVRDGDIGVLFQTTVSGVPSYPTGWTGMSLTDSTFETAVSYKVLSASDGGTTVTGYPDDARFSNIHLHVYRPSKSISVSQFGAVTSNTSVLSSVSINPSSLPVPFLIVAFSGSYTAEPFINEGYWTQVAFTSSTNNARLKTYYLVADDNLQKSITQSADYGSYNLTFIAALYEA